MRVYQINVVCGFGSTGRIAVDLSKEIQAEGGECRIAYGRGQAPADVDAFKISNKLDMYWHAVMTRLTDKHGLYSKRATKRLIKDIREYAPDYIHMHNIHGYYVNYEMLFAFLKEYGKPVVWTLHDCWAFTGHCSHFAMVGCEQWKEQCNSCVQKKRYPSSLLKDNCSDNYRRKKKAFTGVKDMRLITPSKWLADLTRESFLKEYPVEVRYNTINQDVFRPTPSDFREKYGLENKKIILGVASIWDERKGLYDFAELTRQLDDCYAVVLVGLNQKQTEELPLMVKGELEVHSPASQHRPMSQQGVNVDKPAMQAEKTVVRTDKGVAVPAGVENLLQEIATEEKGQGEATLICIPRTNSAKELAEIYTAADVFVNPTYEDNFPTVNLEAIACGTYVVTYLTGGCPETLQ